MKTSVIIPYFNSGAFLEETLRSLDDQTMLPDEVIIIDDGSTQMNSISLLETLPVFSFGNVHVIHQDNAGVSSALTRGAQEATGDIIFTVDADDIIDRQYIQKYVHVFEENQSVDAVVSGYKKFFTEIGHDSKASFHKFFMPKGLIAPDLYYYNCAGGSNTAFRREVLEEIGFWHASFYTYQDWGMWLTLLSHQKTLHVIPEYLYDYRIHSKSNSHNVSMQKDRERLMHRYLQEHFSTFSDMTCETYVTTQKKFMTSKKHDIGHFRRFSFSMLYFRQVFLAIKERL